MDFETLREDLLDLHYRLHHEGEVARARVDAIMAVVARHLEPEPEVAS
ncbi:MAG TPA: hypothetical protein VFE48_22325 [Methylomirabilota bacterium]|nr:hypothetical protein [Methylomirabilota bacterium]